MIKAIIFDCFGVLTSSSWKEFWSSLPTQKQQEEARALNRNYDAHKLSHEEFLQKLSTVTGRTSKQIVETLFGTPEQKNIKLLSYIKSLKPRYKIAILSNVATNWITEELLTETEQLLFDDIVQSFQLGITKPDPKIFHIAAKRLGLKTSECLLIDDIERYCEAARREGMQTIVYDNFGQMKTELETLLAGVDA